jgi:hypothetical protein
MAKVSFHAADASIPITGRTALKSFIETVFKKEKTPLAAIELYFLYR